MHKIRDLKGHFFENVPDHVLEELQQMVVKLGEIVQEIYDNSDPNIFLGGLNFLHALMICQIVTDETDQKMNAAKMYSHGLMKNVEFIIERDKQLLRKKNADPSL